MRRSGSEVWLDPLPGIAAHHKDTITGVHTENIESYWNCVKKKFKRMKVVHRHQLPSYLDEFMWIEGHGKTVREAIENMRLIFV